MTFWLNILQLSYTKGGGLMLIYWGHDVCMLVEIRAKAKSLFNAFPVVVLPAFSCLVEAVFWYSSLLESKFSSVWFLLQF